MSEAGDAIIEQFRSMDTIHSVMAREVPDEMWGTLTTTGRKMGEALKLSMVDAGGHEPGWVSKKAYDSWRSLIDSVGFAALNRELGLPEDYRG